MVWFKKQGRGDMALFQHGCWTTCQGWNWGMHQDGQFMYMDAHGCDCEFGTEYSGACTINQTVLNYLSAVASSTASCRRAAACPPLPPCRH